MFMVTDDLIVSTSSSYSTMNTLNNLKVPFDDVEKYDISLGLKEVSYNHALNFFLN
ncbi:hypothetical protein Hanom_Chr02g00161781 [Helianthus anomalus]